MFRALRGPLPPERAAPYPEVCPVDAANATSIAQHALTQAGIIMAIGAACAVVAKKVNVPDIVLYLLVGMLIGPAMLGVVTVPADSVMNQFILVFGAVCLALALAFGLGGRDVAARFLEKWLEEKKGDHF